MNRPPRAEWSALGVITVVAVLVWAWAANETRTTQTIETTVTLVADGAAGGNWRFTPPQVEIELEVTGSSANVAIAGRSLRTIQLEVAPVEGEGPFPIARLLAESAALDSRGVTVAVADMPAPIVDQRQWTTATATVEVAIPGVELEGPAIAEPATVEVTLPLTERERLPAGRIVVEPVLTAEDIGGGELGRRIERLVALRVRGLPADVFPSIVPDTIQVAFTPRSRTRSVTVDKAIFINVLANPEDEERIEIEPRTFPREWQVELTGPAEAIDSLREGVRPEAQGVPMAVLQLKSTEVQDRITSKPIAGFVVMMPDGRMIPVEGRVATTGQTRPEIAITIRGADEGG